MCTYLLRVKTNLLALWTEKVFKDKDNSILQRLMCKKKFHRYLKSREVHSIYYIAHLTNRGSSWSVLLGSEGTMSARCQQKNVTACKNDILLRVFGHIEDCFYYCYY